MYASGLHKVHSRDPVPQCTLLPHAPLHSITGLLGLTLGPHAKIPMLGNFKFFIPPREIDGSKLIAHSQSVRDFGNLAISETVDSIHMTKSWSECVSFPYKSLTTVVYVLPNAVVGKLISQRAKYVHYND
jgi:hypothetical protein